MSRSALRHRRGPQRIITLPGGPTGYPAQVLADNPRMYLPLGASGLLDVTGNGHNATAVGSPGTGLWVDGTSPASTFNGVNQYLEVADHPALSPTYTGVITIEAWMAPSALTFATTQDAPGGAGDYIHWIGKSVDTQHEYIMRMYQQNPPLDTTRHNRISGYSFNLAGGLGAGSYTQDVVSVGEWMHFVLVINTVDTSDSYPTGYTKIYKNGLLRDQDSLAGYAIIPQHGTAPFRIGATTLDSFLFGKVAQVAVYNTELSAARISAHYRAQIPTVGGTAGYERHVGDLTSTTTATLFEITVGPSGVPAGATLFGTASTSFTSLVATVSDSQGNTWEVGAQRGDNNSTVRTSVYRCQVNNALAEGDRIRLTTNTAVARANFSVDQYRDLAFVPRAATTNTQGNSTTPLISLAPGVTDGVVINAIGVAGPVSDTFTADGGSGLTQLGRIGTSTGTTDITLTSAAKSVGDGSAVVNAPTLGTARNWAAAAAGYQAGTPTPTPAVQGHAQPIRTLASDKSAVSSTTLVLTVPAEVPVGHTLICSVVGDYTGSAPSVTDTAGHVWGAADGTSPMTGSVGRVAVYSCVMGTVMPAGATITITWASAIVHKSAHVGQYAGLAVPKTINAVNSSAAATGSPSITMTPTVADTLLVAAVGMSGPADAPYTADLRWSAAPPVGTTGAGAADKTMYASWQVAGSAAGYPFIPTLQGSYAWAVRLVAYTVTPVAVVVPPAGTATHPAAVASGTGTGTGTTLAMTAASAVPVGQSMVAYVTADHTSTAPTITDTRGNGWQVLRSGPLGTQTRTTIYIATVSTAVQPGDTITVTFPAAVTNRAALVDRYDAVLSPVVVDHNDGASGTTNTPSIRGVPTRADTLVLAAVGIAGPVTDSYLPSPTFTQVGRVGTSGAVVPGDDRTIMGGFVSARDAGTYTYAPQLGVTRGWVALTATVVASPRNYDSVIMASAPTFYLPLDNLSTGLTDHTGHGYNAVATSAPAVEPAGFVDGSGALRFNGSSNYLQVANAAALQVPYTGILTWAMWLRVDDATPDHREGAYQGYVHAAGKGNYGHYGFTFRWYPPDYVQPGDDKAGRWYTYTFTPTASLGTGSKSRPVGAGEWHYVVMEIDTTRTDAELPSTTYRGYVSTWCDGERVSLHPLANYSTIPGTNTDTLKFGAESPPDSFFPGAIARSVLYNRRLTPAEIVEQFRAGQPLAVGNAQVTPLTSGGSTGSGTTLAMTVDRAVPAGQIVVVGMFADATGGSEPFVTDARGNTYRGDMYANGANNAGKTVQFSAALTTGLQPGDTITLTWPVAIAHRTAVAAVMTGATRTKQVANAYSAISVNSQSSTTWPYIEHTPATGPAVIVAVLGFRAGAANLLRVNDPQAWQSCGAAQSTTGTGDIQIVMAARSVLDAKTRSFVAEAPAPATWVSTAVSYTA